MKVSMTGQENVTLKYRWLLNRGDCKGRFDCVFTKMSSIIKQGTGS